MSAPEVDRFDVARVRAMLAMSGVDRDDIDDALQAVRIRMHERDLDSVESLRDATAWAVVVASRIAVDLHRSKARRDSLARRLQSAWQATPPPVAESQWASVIDVARALSTLSPLKRQVLLLRYYQDLTIPTIAELLDVPVGTIKSRLHDAEQAMRSALGEEGAGNDADE